ncbi:hypothetical protein [Phormidium tenue]|uniref:Peptidase M15A C-terminal domain-containing protein n=1 Tax=Phormidium tenue FACHB-1050 TaxID=2692857 RepID=A0ABR8C8F2_9CYAN|nr:hypothetical protein [Phormidium tenue]MBD2316365.1 hypothetical protein [Phormidium tenue FACHB-1050]
MYPEYSLGKYLTLKDFCTCTQTYRRYYDKINPYPQTNIEETILALKNLHQWIIDPVIDYFGKDKFCLTYGFCSPDLKKWLSKKDPVTGQKNGRVAPEIDQHMAHEINKKGNYYCSRLGAACDFKITNITSNIIVDWILANRLPFDSLYFYGLERSLHISYGFQHKRDIRAFNDRGVPTQKGIESWVKLAKQTKE